MPGKGVLALWTDCNPGDEPVFEHWYQNEHMTERLAVPGFMRCRRYEAMQGQSEYFIWYEVATPDVLRSPTYLERLGDPTPLTTEVMTRVMKNTSRTVCFRDIVSAGVAGDRFGTKAVTVKLHGLQGSAESLHEDLQERDLQERDLQEVDLREMASELAGNVDLVRAELWLNDEDADSSVTKKEESLRGGDAKINACLFLEYMRTASAQHSACIAMEKFPAADVGIYSLLCEQAATSD